jgi:predicted RNase H-like nuclease (RuvC/YqgF family)
MHSHEVERKLELKADRHEVYSIRGDVARLERTNGELRTQIDELRHRCERMAEVLRELNPGIASVDGY